jgi:Flp pilus assembly pilin Flp
VNPLGDTLGQVTLVVRALADALSLIWWGTSIRPMLAEILRANRDTRVQYGLMFVFGALCIITAFSPLQDPIRITTVATLFGFTAGLWVSHLVQVLQRAIRATRNQAETTPAN